MSGRLTDYLVEKWLAELSPAWFSLHHSNPDISGSYATEVFGGGYTRAQSYLTPPANRSTWNSDIISFRSMPSGVITHIGLWDASTRGNLLVSVELEDHINVVNSKTLSFAARDIAISLR